MAVTPANFTVVILSLQGRLDMRAILNPGTISGSALVTAVRLRPGTYHVVVIIGDRAGLVRLYAGTTYTVIARVNQTEFLPRDLRCAIIASGPQDL
jgi:hypothetical protein